MVGIYMIKNTRTDEVYIGQSMDIGKRWRTHCNDLADNKHSNYFLQAAWNEYGSSAFDFLIAENFPLSPNIKYDYTRIRTLLILREDYYINLYANNRYNIARSLYQILENNSDTKFIDRNLFRDNLVMAEKDLRENEILDFIKCNNNTTKEFSLPNNKLDKIVFDPTQYLSDKDITCAGKTSSMLSNNALNYKSGDLYKATTMMMIKETDSEWIEKIKSEFINNKEIVEKNKKEYLMAQKVIQQRAENQKYVRVFTENLLSIDLPLHDIARIFYLSTYLARGSNYIITRRNNIAKKNDVMHLLNLNKKTFLRFWDEATKSGILIEDETGVMLDPKMFTRQNGIGKGTPMLRCFESIRELYEEAKVSQHKILGYIFKLLPYLNGYHNIICENPEEHNEEKIIPLSTEEICKIVGYEYSNRSKLMKTLNSISIYRDGIEQFVFLNTYAKEHKNNITIVNPLFFFGGEWAKKDMISALFCKRLYENIKKKSINKNISYNSKDIS